MLSIPWFSPSKGAAEHIRRNVVSNSLAADVPYEEIINNFLIYSDGSIGACYNFSPLYVDSMDSGERNNVTAMLGTMINNIPLGTYAQFVWRKDRHLPVINMHKDRVQAGDPIVHMMTDDRVAHWKRMVQNNEVYGISTELWLRKFYPRSVRRPFNNIVIRSIMSGDVGLSARKDIVKYAREHWDIENDFSSICDSITSPFRSICTGFAQADANEILSSLWRFYTGNPDAPRYSYEKPLRAYFGGWDFTKKWGYLSLGNLDDRLVSVLSVDMFPGMSRLGMINYLLAIDIPMTITMNIAPVSMPSAKSYLRKTMRRYETLLFKADPESGSRFDELKQLLEDLEKTNNLLFDTEMYVVIEGNTLNELNNRRDRFLSEARGREYTINPEKAALELTFRAASPGYCHVGSTDRDIRVKTENIADIAPVLGHMKSAAKPVMLMAAPYQGVFGYDIFDPRLPAYHGLIFGATGSGKSFTMNLLMLSAMSQNPQVYIIDKGGSYKKITSILGGSYVDTTDSRVSFNPMAPKAEWLKRLPTMKLILREMAQVNDNTGMIILERLLTGLFSEFTKEEYGDREPTLSDVWHFLDTHNFYDPDKETNLKSHQDLIRLNVGRWTKVATKGKSTMAPLVDNPLTSVSLENDMVVFDLLGIQGDKEMTNVLFLILADLIERKVTQSVQRNKIIVFDEAWSVLKSRAGAEFLGNLYKTMRKYNCMILSISQSIDDFTDSDVASALIGQTYQMFILRQNNPAEADTIKNILKLNDGERNIIASLTRQKGRFSEVFVKLSGLGSSKFAITPSPVEYWLATTDPNDIKVYNNYIAEGYKVNDAILELASRYPNGVNV